MAAGLERSAINNAVSDWMHPSVTEPIEGRHGSLTCGENILFVREIGLVLLDSYPEKMWAATLYTIVVQFGEDSEILHTAVPTVFSNCPIMCWWWW